MFYDFKTFGGLCPWPLFMGRHHGGRGFGHFMGALGRGGPGFRTGRKLAAADLQLLILALLAEKPSHGYELIKELEERSGGFYSPSPGMIYPALTYIEEILSELERIGGKMERIRRVFTGQESPGGDEDDVFHGSDELRAARRTLKTALYQKHHCSAEEARRIAEILTRAAVDILSK
jgi:hypothetical protein